MFNISPNVNAVVIIFFFFIRNMGYILKLSIYLKREEKLIGIIWKNNIKKKRDPDSQPNLC